MRMIDAIELATLAEPEREDMQSEIYRDYDEEDDGSFSELYNRDSTLDGCINNQTSENFSVHN